MGCDIHGWIEVKTQFEGSYSSEWVGLVPLGDGARDRCYKAFCRLAGVRCYGGETCGHAKGFPNDASQSARFDYERWGVDAHSPTWVTPQEYYDAYRFDGVVPRGVVENVEWILDDYEDMEARIVIWFDN